VKEVAGRGALERGMDAYEFVTLARRNANLLFAWE
jgi:hypothetical protein